MVEKKKTTGKTEKKQTVIKDASTGKFASRERLKDPTVYEQTVVREKTKRTVEMSTKDFKVLTMMLGELLEWARLGGIHLRAKEEYKLFKETYGDMEKYCRELDK
jgi:hypothetical protein